MEHLHHCCCCQGLIHARTSPLAPIGFVLQLSALPPHPFLPAAAILSCLARRPCSPSLGVMTWAALGPDGRQLLGPDGSALRLGPDRVKLVTAAGRPVLSDKGTQLGLAPNGEPGLLWTQCKTPQPCQHSTLFSVCQIQPHLIHLVGAGLLLLHPALSPSRLQPQLASTLLHCCPLTWSAPLALPRYPYRVGHRQTPDLPLNRQAPAPGP